MSTGSGSATDQLPGNNGGKGAVDDAHSYILTEPEVSAQITHKTCPGSR